MTSLFTGAVRHPAAGSPPNQLVILLHGYASAGDHMIWLADCLAIALPHAEFFLPNGLESSSSGTGYQWFPPSHPEPELVKPGVARAAAGLDAIIANALDSRGLCQEQLALVGFSQGAMMAVDRGLRLGGAAAIVGFSGIVADPRPRLRPDANRPPVLLVHGAADPIVPFASLLQSDRELKAAGFPVETLPRPDLGHGMDLEGAEAAAAFLARSFQELR